MVRGEEKQFEATIDHLIDYAKTIKVSLIYFIQRLENEGHNMPWPQVLDSFTSICGQINTLMRFTRENRSQFIENRVVLPLLLSQECDEELAKLTEGRVQVVNHEMVPDYLRTKPDLEIEEQEKSLVSKCSTITPEAAVKQVNAMTKLVENIVNNIRTNSARADNEMTKQAMKTSFITSDTHELVMAISNGQNLKTMVTSHRPMPVTDSLLSSKAPDHKQNPKAPELKTSIKTGP